VCVDFKVYGRNRCKMVTTVLNTVVTAHARLQPFDHQRMWGGGEGGRGTPTSVYPNTLCWYDMNPMCRYVHSERYPVSTSDPSPGRV
jgi:hypothetical protein